VEARAELEALRARKAQQSQLGGQSPQTNARAELEQLRAQKAQQRPEGNPLRTALEVGGTLLSGAIAEPIAGLAGIGSALFNGSADAGADTVRSVQDALTFEPRTQQAVDFLDEAGEFLSPVADAAEFAGEKLGQGGAAVGGLFGDEEAEAAGYAAAKAAPAAVGALLGVRRLPTNVKNNELQESVPREGHTTESTGKRLDDSGKLVKDKAELKAIRQGFEPSVTAVVKGSSSADKSQMLRMLEVRQQGTTNARFAALNRPEDIPGESLARRLNHIRSVNRDAGKRLDIEAHALRGQQVDFDGITNEFIADLESMGVSMNGVKLNFKGSDIEGVDAAENLISKVVQRMASGKRPDAYDVHRMKRFIDEQVAYGKAGQGLTGNSERIVKKLRHNLDQSLDRAFPEYKKVNDDYAETIDVINEVQSIAGKRYDLSDTAETNAVLGRLSRRMLNNSQGRDLMVRAVDKLDRVSKKHGGGDTDDIVSQVVFFNEMNRRFSQSGRTSFQGEIEKGVSQGPGSVLRDRAANKVAEMAGFSDEKAFGAMRQLLEQ